jgi:hypothetical protein
MSVITTGKTFANGEQLSADKLNLMLDNATFSNDAVDLTSTFVDSNGAIVVRDSGITTSKLANNAVTTSKINDGAVAFEKLDDVIDDDTMGTASNTTLATSESIKAYIDTQGFPPTAPTGTTIETSGSVTLPGGLIMKFGTFQSTSDSEQTFTFPSAFPNNIFALTTTRVASDITSSLGPSEFSTTNFKVNRNPGIDGTQDVTFIAIGN